MFELPGFGPAPQHHKLRTPAASTRGRCFSGGAIGRCPTSSGWPRASSASLGTSRCSSGRLCVFIGVRVRLLLCSTRPRARPSNQGAPVSKLVASGATLHQSLSHSIEPLLSFRRSGTTEPLWIISMRSIAALRAYRTSSRFAVMASFSLTFGYSGGRVALVRLQGCYPDSVALYLSSAKVARPRRLITECC